MIKRPFLFVAVFLVFLCLILKGFHINDNLCIEPKKTVSIKAKLLKIEEKNNSDYLFVDAENFRKAIIVVPKNTNLKLGQTIIAECKNIGFNKARNFGNFDEEEYYNSLGYGYKLKASSIKESGKTYDILRQKLYEFRKKITAVFDNTLNNAKAGIFKAIVVGDKSTIETNTKELYQKNGIAHILAISGLHISLIGLAVFSLLNKRFSVFASGIISSIVMIVFCIMSGESVSAIRATIMFVIRMVAIIFGKSFDMLSALSFSAIVILLSNPLYIFNTSFQLSFLAIIAIALIAKNVQNYLELDINKNKIQISLICSVSVFVLTLPVIVNSFFEISLYSIFINLLVIPLMSFILGSALFSAALGIVSIAISRFAIGMGVFLLDAINIICIVIDKFPFSVIITGSMSKIKIIIFYLLLVFFLIFIFLESKKEKKSSFVKRRIICCLTFILLVLIVFVKIPDKKLHISFFDVDQGDGILIQTPKNLVVMIDGGSTSVSDVKEYRLESAIKYKKISKIDYAIVTHPDTDHISGLISFIKDNSAGAIEVKSVYIPYVKNNENYELLKKTCEDNDVPFYNIYSGIYLEEDNLKISCLHPSKNYFNSKSANAYSTVLDLEYGDFNALFVGDLEDDGEKILLKKGLLGKCDVLKVSHHGSRNSSSDEFLKSIKPKISVISAGVNNSYGHPHKETLDRLNTIGSKVYCTANIGEVDLSVDKQGNVAVKTKL